MIKTNLNVVMDSRNRNTVNGKSEFEKRFYTRKETAFMLGVTMVTLWHWDKKGILSPVKIGRKHYYRAEDLEACFRGKTGGLN